MLCDQATADRANKQGMHVLRADLQDSRTEGVSTCQYMTTTPVQYMFHKKRSKNQYMSSTCPVHASKDSTWDSTCGSTCPVHTRVVFQYMPVNSVHDTLRAKCIARFSPVHLQVLKKDIFSKVLDVWIVFACPTIGVGAHTKDVAFGPI